MKALLYKGFSDSYTEKNIEAGKTIENALDGKTSDKILLVNGKIADKNYILKETDIFAVRQLPLGGGSSSWEWYDWALTFATGGLYAVYKYGKDAYDTNKELQEALKKAQKVAAAANNKSSDSVSELALLKGSSNSVATGKTQPYFIGQRLIVPYLMNSGGGASASGYNIISGTDGVDQYYIAVFEGGFCRQVLRKIFCENSTLKTWSNSETVPQEGIFSFDNSSIFYDASSFVEIAQDGQPFNTAAFNHKIVQESHSDTLKKSDEDGYEPLVYTLPLHSMSADICIMFNGLLAYDDSGNKIDRTVAVIPEYSCDSGSSWTSFSFAQGNSFTRNSLSQLRFNAHVDFNYNSVKNLTEPVLIRVRCTTPKYAKTAYDSVTVLWTQAQIYNPDESTSAGAFVAEKLLTADHAAVSALIGVYIKATTTNQDKLDKISIISSGIARTWNGTEWSASKLPTSNPAAWMLEVLTSPTHKPSQCDDSEIDLDAFGEWYEYCAANSIEINQVLLDGATKQSVLESIADAGNASLYMNIYGKISIAIDCPKENAIAILNEQNLTSLEYEKDISRRTDGIYITFPNKDADYANDTYLVYRTGADQSSPDNIYRETTLSGITDFSQVVKYGRRMMAIDELRPKTVTAKVGKEAAFYTPWAKVLVQHPSLKIGLGNAEIKSVIYNSTGKKITGLVLYEPVEYDNTNINGYGVIIQCVSDSYCSIVTAEYTAEKNGRVTEIEFTAGSAISVSAGVIPHAGDILSFGYLNSGAFDTITSPFLITGIAPDSQGYTLTLVDYNEAVYNSGEIPTYTPNITQPETTEKKAPSEPVVSPEVAETLTEIIASAAAQEAADLVTTGVRFTNVNRVNLNSQYTLDDVIAMIDDDANSTKASIQISADEIMLKVEDEANALQAILDIQASAIQAIVSGGGATGHMALSLELPVLADEATAAKLILASSVEIFAAVYAKLAGTDYYAIRSDAASSDVKTLWDKAVDANLLASQISLKADQIEIAGDNIFVNGKLQADYIDVDELCAKELHITNKLYATNASGTQTASITADGKLTAKNAEINKGVFNQGTFNSIEITGNSKFKGDIDSGPLYLSNDAINKWSYTLTAGLNGKEIFEAISISGLTLKEHESDFYKNYFYETDLGDSSYYGARKITYIIFEHIVNKSDNSQRWYCAVRFEDSGVTAESIAEYCVASYGTSQTCLTSSLYVETWNENEKTMLLRNLPTVKPTTIGAIWNDNGTLKIST